MVAFACSRTSSVANVRMVKEKLTGTFTGMGVPALMEHRKTPPPKKAHDQPVGAEVLM